MNHGLSMEPGVIHVGDLSYYYDENAGGSMQVTGTEVKIDGVALTPTFIQKRRLPTAAVVRAMTEEELEAHQQSLQKELTARRSRVEMMRGIREDVGRMRDMFKFGYSKE